MATICITIKCPCSLLLPIRFRIPFFQVDVFELKIHKGVYQLGILRVDFHFPTLTPYLFFHWSNKIVPELQGDWRVEEEFINAIRGKEEITHTNFQDGVRYMEFTEGVTRSSQTGEKILLPF